MSRADAGSAVTSSPSSRMRPEVGSSSPAIIRSVVVLPQPDGPKHDEERAVIDREVHALDGGERSERLGNGFKPDLCHGGQSGK